MDEKKENPEVLCKNCRQPIKQLGEGLLCPNCIEEYTMSISKKSNIPRALKNKGFYDIAARFQVRDVGEQVRDDGKYNINYKCWLTGEAWVSNEKKQKMVIVDKTKESVKTRLRTSDHYDAHEEHIEMSKESFYCYSQGKFRFYFDEIMEFIKKLEEESKQ